MRESRQRRVRGIPLREESPRSPKGQMDGMGSLHMEMGTARGRVKGLGWMRRTRGPVSLLAACRVPRSRVDAEPTGGGAGYNTTDVPSGFMDVREGDKEMFEAGLAPRLSNASMTDLPPRIHSFPSFESNGSQHSSPMGALVWSDWPMDLPSQAVVDHMCTVFFDKVPTLPKMVHRATFMSALQLPPSNSRFPVRPPLVQSSDVADPKARPLLHAMLAISANHISESALASRAYFPVGTPSYFVNHPERDLSEANPSYGFGMYGSGGSHDTTSMAARSLASNFGPRGSANSALARFQLWHRRKAYETSPAYLDKGEQLVAIVQAHVIATTIDQYNAWWVDLWMESGTCMRMCIPLCLHETTDVHPESLDLKNRKRFLAPATDILEQAERDRTWWMVYLLDSSVAMTTVWPIVSTRQVALTAVNGRGRNYRGTASRAESL